METTFGFYDLIETFTKPGCAVCNLLQAETTRLLDSILYEYATDTSTQAAFRDSRGLCSEHGHQLTQMGNALGIAVLYEHPLNDVLRILQGTAPGGGSQARLMTRLFPQNPNGAIIDALTPTKPCIACASQAETEARYVKILSDFADDERMTGVFRASDGLCLPHFIQVLQNTADPSRSRLLIAIQTDIWTRLRDELREFMRKNDYQHASEAITEAEGVSWRRVVARMAGERGILSPRRTIS